LISTSQRAPQYSSLRLWHTSKTQTSPVSWGANTVGRNSMVSWGDPWYTADMDSTRQPGRKKSSSKTGHAWPPP
jgi:hypothetical protein